MLLLSSICKSGKHTLYLISFFLLLSVLFHKVVMCKFHSVFLSVDGKVFTCGHGRGGRLGHGNEETLLVCTFSNLRHKI